MPAEVSGVPVHPDVDEPLYSLEITAVHRVARLVEQDEQAQVARFEFFAVERFGQDIHQVGVIVGKISDSNGFVDAAEIFRCVKIEIFETLLNAAMGWRGVGFFKGFPLGDFFYRLQIVVAKSSPKPSRRRASFTARRMVVSSKSPLPPHWQGAPGNGLWCVLS